MSNFSKILSLALSRFTSTYVMRWKEFFHDQALESPPSFEGQIICIPGPRGSLVRDYLSLRQFYCEKEKKILSVNFVSRYFLFLEFGDNCRPLVQSEEHLLVDVIKIGKNRIRSGGISRGSVFITLIISNIAAFDHFLISEI